MAASIFTIETNREAVISIFASLFPPLSVSMRVSTRGIDAEFIIAATYIFIVTGVTQDIETKSTGSETVKLSLLLSRGLTFLIDADEFLCASSVDSPLLPRGKNEA